jgi:hypothetical protein
MWVSSGDPENTFEELVKKMESMMMHMYAMGLLVHPAVYVSITSTLAWQREPEHAEAIHMEDCEIAPLYTMVAYAANSTVWAIGDDPGKAHHVWQVLKRMHSTVDEKR